MTLALFVCIHCPGCSKSSLIAAINVPDGNRRTRCRRCGLGFPLDKSCELNCIVGLLEPQTAGSNGELHCDLNQETFLIDASGCRGISYNLRTLGGLIRFGMVKPDTTVIPTRECCPIEAGKLLLLKVFFRGTGIGKQIQRALGV